MHGSFDGTITIDHDSNIIANGQRIQVIYASSPAEVDYKAYGITNALVVDNTGRWRDREGLSVHLSSAGASRVLLTAPGKGDKKYCARRKSRGNQHTDTLFRPQAARPTRLHLCLLR